MIDFYFTKKKESIIPRKQRITYKGIYHIINRGVAKRMIFLEDEDYEKFMELIENMLEKFNIKLHAYCLMTIHYHLLLETTDENISEAIQYLNGTYSMYFNKKYKRTGHFWQGRYLSYYLYDDAHAWFVAKYIEQNPIRAKMVNQIEEYAYQSFFQWKNRAKYLKLLENSLIRVLYKRLKNFFEEDIDINRNENMKRAWEYGYSKAEIARFVGLSVVMVGKILK